LREDFDAIWQTRTAKYWRRKEFLPPDCRGCDLANLCCGACPLYWDEVKDFAEIHNPHRDLSGVVDNPHRDLSGVVDTAAPRHAPAWEKIVWQAKRRWIGQAKGVGMS
jgi:hypothetical protein